MYPVSLPADETICLGFSTSSMDDMADFEEILRRRAKRRSGLPVELLNHVRKTKVFRTFVKPLARVLLPDALYTAQDLAVILQEQAPDAKPWTPRRVASKFCVLGRPEKHFGSQIFERLEDSYKLTPEMKAALLAA